MRVNFGVSALISSMAGVQERLISKSCSTCYSADTSSHFSCFLHTSGGRIIVIRIVYGFRIVFIIGIESIDPNS